MTPANIGEGEWSPALPVSYLVTITDMVNIAWKLTKETALFHHER